MLKFDDFSHEGCLGGCNHEHQCENCKIDGHVNIKKVANNVA